MAASGTQAFKDEMIGMVAHYTHEKTTHEHVEYGHVVPFILSLLHEPVECFEEIAFRDVPSRTFVCAGHHLT